MDYDFIYVFIYLLIVIVPASIWGAITWKINDSKGYASNGFWWGFFLGWIGLIVVACKPSVANYEMSGWKCVCGKVHSDYVTACACGRTRNSVASFPADVPTVIPDGGWRCTCGRAHAAYVTSCVCGISKKVATAPIATAAPESPTSGEESTINLLKEYKALLDSGVITQEEFDAKKKSLLNM